MFESTDWEERVKAVALILDTINRSLRWRQLAKEAAGDRERLVDLMNLAPDMSCLIFARMSAIRTVPEDHQLRDLFNLRAATFGDVYAMSTFAQ